MSIVIRRVKRIVFRPGATPARALRGVSLFLLGWGVPTAIFLSAGYAQGYLRGVGDGMTAGAVLFVVTLVFSLSRRQPAGPPTARNPRRPFST
jgi:hypothetical protein